MAELDYNKEVPVPDISTKAKAQKNVGLDMNELDRQKEKFMKEVVPQWDQKAKEREESYNTKEISKKGADI